MSWRTYFGLDAATVSAQPGHARALAAFYAVLALCAGAYLYAAWKGL